MTGAVKQHWHEEICSRSNDEPWGPEPDDLEMLEIDAERAKERYEAALKRKKEEGNEPH